jgi:hypothetical protein
MHFGCIGIESGKKEEIVGETIEPVRLLIDPFDRIPCFLVMLRLLAKKIDLGAHYRERRP